MFFFYFSPGASEAFRAAAKAEGVTYEQIAKKIGVSRGTIAKFVSGRPLSDELLGKVVNCFPGEHGKKILLGHLNDEIKRAGMDPAKFQVIENSPHSYVIENLARLLAEDSRRLADVVALIDTWERGPSK
jgi:transcriptional regulator with XRE-family HTH domain